MANAHDAVRLEHGLEMHHRFERMQESDQAAASSAGAELNSERRFRTRLVNRLPLVAANGHVPFIELMKPRFQFDALSYLRDLSQNVLQFVQFEIGDVLASM